MQKKSIFFILITIFISTSNLFPITGDEAVKKFRDRMFGIKTMTGIISWTYPTGESYTGSFKYLAPGKIYIKLSSHGGKLIVSDGKKLYVYDAGSNVCGVQDLDTGNSGGIAALITDYMGIVTSKGNKGHTLKLKNPEKNYPEIVLLVDSTYMLQRAVVTKKDGESIKFVLSNVDTKASVVRSIFEFNVPANAQVVKNPLNVR